MFLFLQESSSGGGGKKKRSKKDPNAPKKPLSAYMAWLQENREAIKRKYPGSSVAEVAKRAGEMWKTITAEEKAVSSAVIGSFVLFSTCISRKKLFFTDDLEYIGI